MTKLTEEDIKRLQSYPFPYFGGRAKVGFEEMLAKRTEEIDLIMEIFFTHVYSIGENDKFFMDRRLIYMPSVGSYAVRGVLQEKKEDGSIIETDKEIEFGYGFKVSDPKRELIWYGSAIRNLSEGRIVKNPD